MNAQAEFYLLLATLLGLAVLCVKPLGLYMADVMEGRPGLALRIGGRFETALYRLCGIDSDRQMGWVQYAIALLVVNTFADWSPSTRCSACRDCCRSILSLSRPSTLRFRSTRPRASLRTRTGRHTAASRR